MHARVALANYVGMLDLFNYIRYGIRPARPAATGKSVQTASELRDAIKNDPNAKEHVYEGFLIPIYLKGRIN